MGGTMKPKHWLIGWPLFILLLPIFVAGFVCNMIKMAWQAGGEGFEIFNLWMNE